MKHQTMGHCKNVSDALTLQLYLASEFVTLNDSAFLEREAGILDLDLVSWHVLHNHKCRPIQKTRQTTDGRSIESHMALTYARSRAKHSSFEQIRCKPFEPHRSSFV